MTDRSNDTTTSVQRSGQDRIAVAKTDMVQGPLRRYNSNSQDYESDESSPLIPRNDGPYLDDDDDDGEDEEARRARGSGGVYPGREGQPPVVIGSTQTWYEWSIQNYVHPVTWTKETYIKAGLLTLLVTMVILCFTVFHVQDHVKDILRYIDTHKQIGAILFVASYTVACWLFLPGSLFTIGAGFLFKPFPFALAVVLVGDIFGCIGSFFFGRYIFHDAVKGMMSKHPKFNALEQVIKDDGWKIVVLLRLTPIPFNLITYFFSITSIRLWTIVWATCLGVLPGSCIGIWIGSLLKGLSGIDNPELETKNVVVIIMNGIFIVCCICALSLFGKRSLRKAMKRLDQHQRLTSLHTVDVVVVPTSGTGHAADESTLGLLQEVEGDADAVSLPPSLRSTMIEQLDLNNEDFFGVAAAAAAAEREQERNQQGLHASELSDDRYDDQQQQTGTGGAFKLNNGLLAYNHSQHRQQQQGVGAGVQQKVQNVYSKLTRVLSNSSGGRIRLPTGNNNNNYESASPSFSYGSADASLPQDNSSSSLRTIVSNSRGPSSGPSSGFTKGEKWTFVVIGMVAFLNICVCVPLYFHFANQE